MSESRENYIPLREWPASASRDVEFMYQAVAPLALVNTMLRRADLKGKLGGAGCLRHVTRTLSLCGEQIILGWSAPRP